MPQFLNKRLINFIKAYINGIPEERDVDGNPSGIAKEPGSAFWVLITEIVSENQGILQTEGESFLREILDILMDIEEDPAWLQLLLNLTACGGKRLHANAQRILLWTEQNPTKLRRFATEDGPKKRKNMSELLGYYEES